MNLRETNFNLHKSVYNLHLKMLIGEATMTAVSLLEKDKNTANKVIVCITNNKNMAGNK